MSMYDEFEIQKLLLLLQKLAFYDMTMFSDKPTTII